MFLFIFGKDPELSKVELSSYLTTSNITFKIEANNDRFCILDVDGDFDSVNIMQNLGGILRIGKLIAWSNYLSDNFAKSIEIYTSKFNYAISSLGMSKYEYELHEDILKNHFKDSKIKAYIKNNHPKNIDFNMIDPKIYNSWNLDLGFELIILKHNESYYYFKTNSATDPKDYEERDLKRPNRVETHATSPRISQMLVNCLGLEEDSVIIDPFCGTGTLLIEALLKGYGAVGIDNDLSLVQSSRENIEWAKNRFGLTKASYNLIHGEAQNAKFNANACVFEPYMGPFLRKIPSQNDVFEIAYELEDIYSGLFENLKENLKPKSSVFDVVCILPYFKTKEGRIIGINHEVFEKSGFSLAKLNDDEHLTSENPLEYGAAGGNFIGRRIYFLKKM